MRITDVDIIPIYPRLVARAAAHNAHYPDWNLRTVFRVKADNGLIGYGDYRCPPPDPATVAPLIGRSPFDFVGNDFNPGLGGALYDLMGKYLDQPAYKLMGQKVRDWVPVAAWTKPVPPETLAAEVKRAVAEGYSAMKMHSIEYYDIFEQNQAVEEAAPPGFLMHYDFNYNRSLANVLPVVDALARSRVVGWIEDPLRPSDVAGWQQLRSRTPVPLIMHPTPLGGLAEIHLGLADAYMMGGQIGLALRRGGALTAANAAGVLQITGGTLTKALAMHLAAVIPPCSLHTINLDDQYEDDVTTERIPVVEGTSPVPDRPGLGYDVDEDALARLAANPPTAVPKHVAALRRRGGRTIYFPSLMAVDLQRMTGREEGTIRGLRLELWDDDGSAEFERVYRRVNAGGPFVE
jgi:L-alanine-DL-glutamate epimerase-like enolase superfamily enzyme